MIQTLILFISSLSPINTHKMSRIQAGTLGQKIDLKATNPFAMIVKDGGLVRAALGAVDLILVGVTLQVEDFRDLNKRSSG